MSDIHVVPLDDLRDHDETRGCWCEPRVLVGDIVTEANVVVHNSADGRELVEEHGLQ